ncbi:hypothetical protein [Flavobacterium tructae]|uniref:hypothetical protein n=1 Tax=Flavobacterium tructae TaxID=1114873 RepID=UPI001F3FBCF0|nr:hypothetical protein [Flavobacterium tructae]
MKKLLVLTVLLILQACSTAKNTNDQWIGQSKNNLIKAWGPPIRTINNQDHGEILIYADQVYANTNTSEGVPELRVQTIGITLIYTPVKTGKFICIKPINNSSHHKRLL